jgi:signal transduction histidine kinase
MPLLAWLMLSSRQDVLARIWFAGLGFYAAGALLHALEGWLPGWLPLIGGPAVAFVMVLCMYEALRRDIAPGPSSGWRLLFFWLTFVGSAAFWYAKGVRTTWGQVHASVFWSIAEAVLFRQALVLRRMHASRGALIIALAMLLGLSSHALRMAHVLWAGGSFHLLDLKPVTNYFYLINIIGITLCSFGYWGYLMEKTQQKEMASQALAMEARTEARLALKHAEQMQALVQQRDQMLMLNSRFSAINSLAIFNSAVIHEVSQPVQTISLCLEHAAMQVNRAGQDALRGPLNDALHQVKKLASLLSVMRKLVSTQQDELEVVHLSEVEKEILPVLRSEVSRRGVVWQEELSAQAGTVHANKVLLERLLFNLVGNALDAVSEQIARGEAAHIQLSVQRVNAEGAARLFIVVQDDGPGLAEPERLLMTEVFQSTKANGMGVGLAFAGLVVRQWGGELTIENRTDGQHGVRAALSLPALT